MLLYSVAALWVIGGQHGVAACAEICKDMTERMGNFAERMTNFDVCIIKFDTSVEIRRKLAGQHNRLQHSGRESSVPQLLNNFLQLAAEDTQCNKTLVTLMCEAIMGAGLAANSGNTETIVKQMRPAAHMAVTCGTTFTDELSKMVERKRNSKIYAYATTWPCRRVQYQASRSLQRSSVLGNCGGITLVIPTCRLSASPLQDVCYCLVSLLPFVVRHCNATPIQWAAATGCLDEV